MSLKDPLTNDLKEAMKSGEQVKKETVRALRGAIRNVEIDSRRDLTDEEILDIINKQAKQRRDSIEQYQKANRSDLVEQEQQELAIIEAYLPQQLTDAEIKTRVETAIAELGVSDMKGMGPVMKRLTVELKGRADGKRISQLVRELLSNK
ncbi:MAG TPA: GatB/YqeY domain-containing protein [Anaerolineae bacterium]|nr:GatB/YqeY domain-containing protein [Anaerolineae bacterium]